MAQVDSGVGQAYADVRADSNPTQWALFGYETGSKSKIHVQTTGTGDWEEFAGNLKDNQAQFGFVRFQIPVDKGSDTFRSKFVFVSWVGQGLGALQRAKVSVHKASVKEVVRDFAVEIMAEDKSELDHERVINQVLKAGGANYGTGARRD